VRPDQGLSTNNPSVYDSYIAIVSYHVYIPKVAVVYAYHS
jgi:hypothetical protein